MANNLYEPRSRLLTLKSVDKETQFPDLELSILKYDGHLFRQSHQHSLNENDPLASFQLWSEIFHARKYAYRVSVYNERIAYHCQLPLFTYHGKHYVTVAQPSTLPENDEPYLSAYMYLTLGHIHPNSSLLTDPTAFQQLEQNILFQTLFY